MCENSVGILPTDAIFRAMKKRREHHASLITGPKL
jgi:hypothetical protein